MVHCTWLAILFLYEAKIRYAFSTLLVQSNISSSHCAVTSPKTEENKQDWMPSSPMPTYTLDLEVQLWTGEYNQT